MQSMIRMSQWPLHRGGRATPAPTRFPKTTRAAIYLRCFPTDAYQMDAHQSALHRYADSMGLTGPPVLLDNGATSTGPRPRLDLLTALVADGLIDVVLIPGPWVFSLDDREAQAVAARLTRAGCRIMELSRP